MSSLNWDLIHEIVTLAIHARHCDSGDRHLRLKEFINYQGVCQQWKSAFEHDRTLWAACVDFFGQSTAVLDEVLSRSGNALLEVEPYIHFPAPEDEPLTQCRRGHPVLRRIIAELHRIRALRLTFQRSCCMHLFGDALAKQHMPNLKECSLQKEHNKGFNITVYPYSTHGASYRVDSPSLKTLRVGDFPLDLTSIASARALQIFDWHSERATALDQLHLIVQHLRECPLLRSCIIGLHELPKQGNTPKRVKRLDRVYLSNLVQLELYAPLEFIQAFFEALSIPPEAHARLTIAQPSLSLLQELFGQMNADRFAFRGPSHFQRRLFIDVNTLGNHHFDLMQQTIGFSSSDREISPGIAGETRIVIHDKWGSGSGLDARLILPLFDLAGPDFTTVTDFTLLTSHPLPSDILAGLHDRLQRFTGVKSLTLHRPRSAPSPLLEVLDRFDPNLFPALEVLEEDFQAHICTEKHVQQLIRVFKARQRLNLLRCRYIIQGINVNNLHEDGNWKILEDSDLDEVLEVDMYH